jgi:hypothetical protein
MVGRRAPHAGLQECVRELWRGLLRGMRPLALDAGGPPPPPPLAEEEGWEEAGEEGGAGTADGDVLYLASLSKQEIGEREDIVEKRNGGMDGGRERGGRAGGGKGDRLGREECDVPGEPL